MSQDVGAALALLLFLGILVGDGGAAVFTEDDSNDHRYLR